MNTHLIAVSKLISAVIVASIVALLSGCETTQNGYQGSHPVQRTEDNQLNSIVFIDHALNRTEINRTPMGETYQSTVKVTIDQSGIRDTPTGNMEVWAVLRNRTDYDLQVEGKAMFYDNGKAPLNDETMWRRVYVPANGTAVYRETSVNNMASYFLVELREGR